MKKSYVYILASNPRGTLFTGVTNDLIKRIWEHKKSMVAGFTNKYKVHNLVYYELHEDINSAILREKQIKKWIPASAGMTASQPAMRISLGRNLESLNF